MQSAVRCACTGIIAEVNSTRRFEHGGATVVERLGRITGYATAIAFFGHAVGESNDDIRALIGAAPAFLGPGILVPTRNGELFRWCLGNGLRLVQQTTLMTIGLYNEPSGAYPFILNSSLSGEDALCADPP